MLNANFKTMKPDLTLTKKWAAAYHAPQYKTAIHGEQDYLYHVVTRVNHHTAAIWLAYQKSATKGKKGFIELPDKPNWMVMTKSFRREQDKLLKQST